MPIEVEVCVANLEGALCAEQAGVDRIELCSWPTCGGVTPSLGTVQLIEASVHIPLRTLIRPGPGPFQYDVAEIDLILADAQIMLDRTRCQGLVLGALDQHGATHEELIRSIMSISGTTEITFHRAIDHAADPMKVVECCSQLGIHRILSSGAANTAIEGSAHLAKMVRKAGPSLRVAAAGGITPHNVVEVVERSGVVEVHFAALQWQGHPEQVSMSSSEPMADRMLGSDQRKIEGVLNALVKAGLR